MGPALWGRAARHLRVLSRPIALNGPTGSPVVDFRATAAKITPKLAVRGLRGTPTTQAFAQEPRRRLNSTVEPTFAKPQYVNQLAAIELEK